MPISTQFSNAAGNILVELERFFPLASDGGCHKVRKYEYSVPLVLANLELPLPTERLFHYMTSNGQVLRTEDGVTFEFWEEELVKTFPVNKLYRRVPYN